MTEAQEMRLYAMMTLMTSSITETAGLIFVAGLFFLLSLICKQ